MTERATAACSTCARSARCVRVRLSRIERTLDLAWSTKRACSAPRDSASIPIAPVPANRSRTRSPTTEPRLENTPSRTRSDTGRTPCGTGPSRTPFASPAMTRTRPLASASDVSGVAHATDELGAGAQAELAHHARAVVLDRSDGHGEHLGDPGVRVSQGDQAQHL